MRTETPPSQVAESLFFMGAGGPKSLQAGLGEAGVLSKQRQVFDVSLGLPRASMGLSV